MVERKFDYSKKDSQGTDLIPISPEKFDSERYNDYEAALLERNEKFWKSDSGLAIYRRFRSPKVFMDACRDKKLSLALQLGGLQESIKYQADISKMIDLGVRVIGGCCGTSPNHINSLRKYIDSRK